MISDMTLQRLLAFRKERDLEQFHTFKNLAISITLEAAELLEKVQWTPDPELRAVISARRNEISDEIADIAIYLAYMAHDLGLHIDDCVRAKLATNEEKYPVEKAKGRSDKYDRLKEGGVLVTANRVGCRSRVRKGCRAPLIRREPPSLAPLIRPEPPS